MIDDQIMINDERYNKLMVLVMFDLLLMFDMMMIHVRSLMVSGVVMVPSLPSHFVALAMALTTTTMMMSTSFCEKVCECDRHVTNSFHNVSY
jgi:hypothetical protein